MKPMLAAATDGTDLRYPVMVSPKLDGVRCLIKDGVAVSRSLKPIPNKHVQLLFGRKEYNGLDGELIVVDTKANEAAGDVFQRTTSGVMSIEGHPKVLFFVFDDFSDPALKFKLRLVNAAARCAGSKHLQFVKHFIVRTKAGLDDHEEKFLRKGFEGLMARDPDGEYKFGRSTLKQGWLLKLKRFEDSEAKVIGWEPLKHNHNIAQLNALGHQERSTKQAGKQVDASLMGALVVQDTKTKVEFGIGTGFTEAQRRSYRDNVVGLTVKYKYQPTGVKEKPRFPVFLGFRDSRDL